MACFSAPLAESVIVKVAEVHARKKEKEGAQEAEKESSVIPFSRKLKWLTNLLWGGSALLAFEHVWHGEIVPWFPFLTAMQDPADMAEMLSEIATVGVSMSVLLTVVWLVMCKAADAIVKRSDEKAQESAA